MARSERVKGGHRNCSAGSKKTTVVATSIPVYLCLIVNHLAMYCYPIVDSIVVHSNLRCNHNSMSSRGWLLVASVRYDTNRIVEEYRGCCDNLPLMIMDN
jgi:hypothetical protein